MYAEVDIPSNNARRSSDEKPPIKPYMEVDITEPPLTPTGMKERNSMGGESEDQNEPYELPEGWREVKGDSGTYYWHVASGTTQWTLPQVATRPKVLNDVLPGIHFESIQKSNLLNCNPLILVLELQSLWPADHELWPVPN